MAPVWFRKSDFLDYLFVFSVATLDDSGSHLLLLPEWTTLCRKAEQRSSDCAKTGQWFLTAAHSSSQGTNFQIPPAAVTWSDPHLRISQRRLYVQFMSERKPSKSTPGLSMQLATACTWRTFSCASTEHMPQHGILALVQQMLCKHQQVNAKSTENVTTETGFSWSLGWILPTCYSATNCTLTSNAEDILCSGHVPYIS